MMKNRFFPAVILIFGLCWTYGWAEASPRYILRSRTIKMPPYGEEEWDVWLWDSKRSRVIWKRHLNYFDAKQSVHWSKDRQALAIECGIPRQQLRVLVWREGYRLRDFGVPGGNDYTMGCIWSPDKRRLLVRVGGSGSADLDYGFLYCLKLGRWPHYKYYRFGGMVRKMAWKSRKTAIFWEVSDDYARLRPPRLWHAP